MSKISTYPSADTPLQLSDRLIGTEAFRTIPSPTPLATKNFSLGELLQLFSANFPAASLQAVLDTGNTATQNITLTGTITTTLIKPNNIEDTSGSQGTTFQYLSKGTSSINWVDLPVDNLQDVLNKGNTATQNITLVGNITSTKIIPGNIQDDTSGIGTTGQFLSKTASGIRWVNTPFATTPTLGDVVSVGNTANQDIFINSLRIGKGTGTGSNNTALGYLTLGLNTTGYANAGVGAFSLTANTTGNRNTALGYASLYNNISGNLNTAVGTYSQYLAQTGIGNVSIGYGTLLNNVLGSFSTSLGYRALEKNIADKNTAVGAQAMFLNTTGTFNTAIGQEALTTNLTGSYNTAVGNFALLNAEANYVSALGRDAGRFSSAGNLISSTESIFIGYNSKSLNTTSANEIVIGANAVGEGNNTVTIGHTTITSTRLRGAVKGGSFVKDGGTNLQYLMADGSVTTGPILTGYVPYIGATGAVDLGPYDLTVNSILVGRGGGNMNSNTIVGQYSLINNTTGYQNTALGYSSMISNTTGYQNVALGSNTLSNNTTGYGNVAVGDDALSNNTLGNDNIAIGKSSLLSSNDGVRNIAIGLNALNGTGISHNIGIGYNAGNGISGTYNVSIGEGSGLGGTSNISIGTNTGGRGSESVAIGSKSSRQAQSTSIYNIAIGYQSLYSNLIGIRNSSIGANSLYNANSSYNVAFGYDAGRYILTEGGSPNTSPQYSVYLGYKTKSATASDNNSIVIGYDAISLGSNTTVIGNTSITTTRLRGNVQGGAFVKDGGTSLEYLMADGSVSTGPSLTGYVPTSRTISTTSPLQGGGDLTANRTLSILQSSSTQNGYLSSTDWNTFNGKQNTITLTTTGSSGSSTLVGSTLNIPTYTLAGLGGISLTSLSSTATGLTYTNTTGVFSLTSGYLIPTTASYNNTNWDSAYTNRITSLTTTGTGAATLISNVLNIPTPPTATFTSLTTTGSSGSSTLISGVLNVPTYTLSGLGGQPLATNLTSLSGLTFTSTSFVKMTAAGTFALDTNTYLTGNQSITLSGDISGTGTTAITTTIGANKVTNSMLAQVATATFKGRTTASTGNVEDLTGTQATALLDTFSSTLKGLAPASGGGTTNFLRADGTWAVPSGGTGISGGVHTIIKIQSGQSTSVAREVNTVTGATVGVANRLFTYPYVPAQTTTSSSLYFNVTTLAVGTNARILIYSDLNGVPNTKLYESTDLSTATIGQKTVTTTQTFTAGTTYWLAIHYSGTPTLSAFSFSGASVMPIYNVGITAISALYTTVTFGSAPTTFGSTTGLVGANLPFIGITV